MDHRDKPGDGEESLGGQKNKKARPEEGAGLRGPVAGDYGGVRRRQFLKRLQPVS